MSKRQILLLVSIVLFIAIIILISAADIFDKGFIAGIIVGAVVMMVGIPLIRKWKSRQDAEQ